MPDPPFLSVEGPEFAERVRVAEGLTRRLEEANWDFAGAREVFVGRYADCDVAAKEIVNVFDGRTQIRFGRLVMKGAGGRFNLFSHESPLSTYLGGRPRVFAEINRQVGSEGLGDFDEFRALGRPQEIQFYNPTVLYQLRDIVFFAALNGFGLFPTGFEDLGKQIAAGNVIRNLFFEPALDGAGKRDEPVYMQGYSGVRFPTEVLEWMPKPLYGGMSAQSFHVDTVLTHTPMDLSHPYLPLVAEGRVEFAGDRWHMRRFAGISQKDATRGPEVPPEGVEA